MRKNLGRGMGKGYYNILAKYDSKIHSDSGRGIKQPQLLSRYGLKPIIPKIYGLSDLYNEIEQRQYRDIVGLKTEITEQDYNKAFENRTPIEIGKDYFIDREFLAGDKTLKFYYDNGKYYAEVVDYRAMNPNISEKEYLIRKYGDPTKGIF